MASDGDIEATILALLQARAATASICPSEVARALAPDESAWRPLMPAVRRVAAAMASARRLRVTARGVDVDASDVHGPIRLARRDPRGQDPS